MANNANKTTKPVRAATATASSTAASVTLASRTPAFSLVLETPASDPATANRHFTAKLAVETDPSDVYADLQKGVTGFIVVDPRSPASFAKGHIPGAINIPYRTMNEETTAALPKDKLIVAYCSGVGCNASTKGAARLTALGFRVKEMVGGLAWWKEEGYPVETA